MLSNSLITALVACSSITAALPSSFSASHAFSVPQKATGKKKLRLGPVAVENTYKKFGVPVPQHIQKASAAAQQGSVTASPQQYDEAYLCPVSVGTPAQTLMLDFDTGSADLWVFSSQQSSSQRAGHSYYTPGSSSTGRLYSGETWNIRYGDGSGASGNIYNDKVVIGPVTATTQAVEAATSVSSSFVSNTDNDGLVGLAFSSINTASPTKVTTFMDTVKSTLTSPIFASYLRHAAAGKYDFGFIDTSKYTGTLDYKSVYTGNGFWEFVAEGYTVGGVAHSGSIDAIADTGTTLMYLPASICNAYYSQVSGASNSATYGGYVFPCSSTLPSFGIIINGHTHTVPGSYMSYAPASSSLCFGGLQSSSGIGINILGDIFLKSQYVVYDLGSTRIGFGQAV